MLTSHQFAEWMAYSAIEPWGEDMEWLRHGIQTALIANVNRDSTKRPQPFSARDFMPKRSHGPTSTEMSEADRLEQIRQKAREMTARFNAKKAQRLIVAST